jgi:CSLREA domain-containing protein
MKKFLAGAFALFVLLLAPAAANAVSINVNTTTDEYNNGPGCSLREAITAAQTNVAFGGCPAGFGSDTINLPGGDYLITRAGADEDANVTGDFDVTGVNDLVIQPSGPQARVLVDGNQLDRVFDKSTTGELKLTALRVTNGLLTLIEDGGGIRNSVGTTSLEEVTVDNNSSKIGGGGIANYAQLQVINSTISQNVADGSGGGIYIAGGTSTNLRSSTIYGNTADGDGNGNGSGGGFSESGGLNVSFTNVLNAGNSGTPSMPPNQAYDCDSGPNFFPRFTLQGQALGPADCLVGFNPGTNQVTSDALVDQFLRYNGGRTPTHALLPGSPAINAGGVNPPDECPGIDQNGVGRPAGSCDIGAVEFVAAPKFLITKLLPNKKVIKRKKTRAITVVVKNTGTGAAAGTKVCLSLPKAAKKGLKVKGKACRNVGAVPINGVKRPKIKLTAKPKARKKAYTVKSTVRATGVAVVSRTFKVRVK